MKIILVGLAVVVACVLLVAIVGWNLPVRHRAARQATFAASPDVVFEIIANVEQFPTWRSNVKSVDRVAMPGEARGFREVSGDGTILYAIDEGVPGRRLVTRIADPSLPFGGTWTYALTPATNGTVLRITEDGEVHNPIFRFVSRFVISQHATIDAYLTDLGRKLGTVVQTTD
jgi:uncharacterized protein YndB with AHSA1/START domain